MASSDRLSQKIALVTGAASGIGESISQLFAREGARLVMADLQERRGGELEARIRADGGEVHFMAVDLQKGLQIPDLVTAAANQFGGLDILVNNAGFYGPLNKKSVVDTTEEVWNRTMDVNLRAPFLLAKYAIPHMVSRGGGSIINISSIGGLEAFPEFAAYSTSKGGLIQLTKSLAIDFGRQGIRANSICPGAIDTPGNDVFIEDRNKFLQTSCSMTALNRIGAPMDVAQAALFLASDESSYITGTAIVVDGGRMAIA